MIICGACFIILGFLRYHVLQNKTTTTFFMAFAGVLIIISAFFKEHPSGDLAIMAFATGFLAGMEYVEVVTYLVKKKNLEAEL